MKDLFDHLIEHLLDNGFFLQEARELLEKGLIMRAMQRTKGNRCAAAKMLGIHRNTLQRKCEEYEMQGRRKPPRKAEGPRRAVRAKTR
jgi:Fis family transcriptional regulator, factor for inversion stimulation protein